MTITPQTNKAVELVNRLTSTGSGYNASRWGIDTANYKTILFWHGVQWATINNMTTVVRPMNLLPFVPRPVTNRLRQYADVLIALLSRVEPNVISFPANDSNEQDIEAADIAKKVLSVLHEENDLEAVRDKSARLLVLTGNSFIIPGVEAIPNPQEAQLTAVIQELMKQAQQHTDQGQRAAVLAQLDQYISALEALPKNKRFYTEVLSPFEVFANLNVDDIKDQSIIVTVQVKDIDWVGRTFNVDAAPDTMSSIPSMQFLQSIPYISNENLTAHGGLFGYRGDNTRNVYVKRVWMKPTREYPDGLHATIINGRIVGETYPLPRGDDGQTYIPVIHNRFDPIPGAFFGRSPLYQIIPKQMARNRWESTTELIHMRTGMPQWIKTPGTTMSINDTEPNAIITFNMVGDKAQPPQRLQGVPLDRAAAEYMQSFDKEMGEMISVAEVLLGRMPYSGSPAALADILIQQGLSRFGPVFRLLAKNYVAWARIELALFREHGQQTRTFRALNDEGDLSIQSFSAADLTSAVNIRLENNSVEPKSDIIETARLQTAIQNQLLDLTDPTVRLQALRQLQLQKLVPESDLQSKSASRENRLLLAGQMVQASALLDDFNVHFNSHRKAANNPKNTPQQKAIMEMHIMDHIIKRDALLLAQTVPAVTPQKSSPK